jgi:hypothetical protein
LSSTIFETQNNLQWLDAAGVCPATYTKNTDQEWELLFMMMPLFEFLIETFQGAQLDYDP